MKKIIALCVCAALCFALAGCGGQTSQESSSDSESEQFETVKEALDEYLTDATYVEYEFNGRKIFNVIMSTEDFASSEAETVGELIGSLMLSGDINYDFFYIDAVHATGERGASLLVSSTGGFWQAIYEETE